MFFRILANRINELEKTLESWCSGQKCIPIFPSQMLLDEILPDSVSVKSDETKENNSNDQVDDSELKVKYSDSEEELNKTVDHKQVTKFENYDDDHGDNKRFITKTVLPLELEELVKEALADLKPIK